MLTTGLEWWLYLPRESGPPSERRFAVLNVTDDPVEQLLEDFNAFLSKETLDNGQAEKRAQAVRKAGLEAAQLNKEIPSIWKEMLEEPDDELAELLSKRIYEKVNLRPTKPQVMAALQGSPIPSVTIPTDSVAALTAPTPSVTGPSGLTWVPWRKPTAIVLWGNRYPVSAHVDAWRKFLDVLYERHRDDFHAVLGIRGTKYPHVARDPQMLHKDGRTYHYQPKSSGYFFAIPNSPEGLERRAGRFLECLGHSASDFKVQYDQDPAE